MMKIRCSYLDLLAFKDFARKSPAVPEQAAARGTKPTPLIPDRNSADVNATTPSGRTQLHAAAARGKGECVDILLEKGARINAADREGKTALTIAADSNHKKTERHLFLFQWQVRATQMRANGSSQDVTLKAHQLFDYKTPTFQGTGFSCPKSMKFASREKEKGLKIKMKTPKVTQKRQKSRSTRRFDSVPNWRMWTQTGGLERTWSETSESIGKPILRVRAPEIHKEDRTSHSCSVVEVYRPTSTTAFRQGRKHGAETGVPGGELQGFSLTSLVKDAGQQGVRPAAPQQQGIRPPASYSAVCDNRSSRFRRTSSSTATTSAGHTAPSSTTSAERTATGSTALAANRLRDIGRAEGSRDIPDRALCRHFVCAKNLWQDDQQFSLYVVHVVFVTVPA
ncbi:Ankyrin repeat domain-containing protein 60 [Branchiostoma belcheri]|nr:Ankyrin repeat domain-containing protein 60 [Branchiostoma belcheri]